MEENTSRYRLPPLSSVIDFVRSRSPEAEKLTDVQTDRQTYLSVGNANGIEEYKVYKRRWYILFLYCLVTFNENFVWNTWGPISVSANLVYNWPTWMIPLIANWGIIPNTFGMPATTWIMENKGLRWAIVGASGFSCFGCALRIFTTTNPAATWLINLSAILNGISSPPVMTAPPMLSNAWFPVNERSTATAIGASAVNWAICISYIIGPVIVQFHGFPKNISFLANSTNTSVEDLRFNIIEDQKQKIMIYMYITFAWTLFVFILTIIYFPSKPSLPPSKSASIERVDFVRGCKDILVNKQEWIVLMAYAVPVGIYFGWSSVLDILLTPLGITQIQAGWIGFTAVLSGAVAAMVIGRLSDRFQGRAKWIILGLYFVGGIMLIWMSLILARIAPSSLWIIYITIIIAMACLNGPTPLLYEIAADAAYPVAECLSTGFLIFWSNFFGAILLFIFFIPHLNTDWVTWIMTASMFVGFFFLLFYKEDYKRLKLDTAQESKNDGLIIKKATILSDNEYPEFLNPFMDIGEDDDDDDDDDDGGTEPEIELQMENIDVPNKKNRFDSDSSFGGETFSWD